MKKVYLFYIVTASCLFLALFAIFALLGIGSDPLPSTELAKQVIKPKPKVRIDYPGLQAGTQYSVSQRTVIWGDPEGLFNRQENLPAGGVFRLEGRDETVEEHWYRITVNNGFEDYTMYLKAEALNWQDVQAIPEKPAGPVFPGRNLRAIMRERIATGRDPEAAPAPEPAPEATTFEHGMTSLRSAVDAVSSQGLASAALAAILIIAILAATVSLIVWFQRSHRWQRSTLYDEQPSERGEEFYEDEQEEAYGDESHKTGSNS